jgi:hypothetical protein
MNSPFSPAAQIVWQAYGDCFGGVDWLMDSERRGLVAAIRAAAAQMIKTGDLTDTAEDIIRGAERHHQAGWLCTIAAELEGSNG